MEVQGELEGGSGGTCHNDKRAGMRRVAMPKYLSTCGRISVKVRF